jgi:hypothetical protein
MPRTAPLALFLLAMSALPLAAQADKRPDGWRVRFDEPGPDSTKLTFVAMPPGWHITTGPAAIFYNPATTGKGTFKADVNFFLFKPASGHAEAYGMFVGGTTLDAASQSYTYFLIRNDGQYLVKIRKGDDTKDVIPWTASPAIKIFDGKSESVPNSLTVLAGATTVDFLINGTKVASKPRADLPVDGIVGLRVNHRLNVHVSKLEVTATK